MSQAVRPIPEGMHTITPHLVCAGVKDAIAFYAKAFGATSRGTLDTPDGKVMHAQITIGDSPIMLVDENPDWKILGPKALGGTPISLHIYVNDADAVFKQAIAAGATVGLEMSDMFWGDRYGMVVDPWGHKWSIATHVRDVPMDEMVEASRKMCDGQE
jgi:uncharacterized glyoxalase superfamily protein PhnB